MYDDPGSSFSEDGLSTPHEAQEVQDLQTCRGQIESIYNLLVYEVDLREVRKSDIDLWESDLRAIIAKIRRMRTIPNIEQYLYSVDGVQKAIEDALDHLYLASDILQKKNTSIKERKIFYQNLRDCSMYLAEALQHFPF